MWWCYAFLHIFKGRLYPWSAASIGSFRSSSFSITGTSTVVKTSTGLQWSWVFRFSHSHFPIQKHQGAQLLPIRFFPPRGIEVGLWMLPSAAWALKMARPCWDLRPSAGAFRQSNGAQRKAHWKKGSKLWWNWRSLYKQHIFDFVSSYDVHVFGFIHLILFKIQFGNSPITRSHTFHRWSSHDHKSKLVQNYKFIIPIDWF